MTPHGFGSDFGGGSIATVPHAAVNVDVASRPRSPYAIAFINDTAGSVFTFGRGLGAGFAVVLASRSPGS